MKAIAKVFTAKKSLKKILLPMIVVAIIVGLITVTAITTGNYIVAGILGVSFIAMFL
jgi:ABC-type spermidine/putrescine transport system permease subunit I